MKKIFFAFSFVLASFSIAQAQSGVGVRVGANLSNVSGDLQNEDLFKNKFGFHAGLTYNVPIIENFFSVQPELLYSQKGFKNDDSEFTVPIVNDKYRREGSVNYNYIDLPVLAKINAGPIYFEAGPQASYLLNVKNSTKFYKNGELQQNNKSDSSTDGLKRFEVGYAAGLGLASNNGISIGLRYNGSFSDFTEKDVDYGDYGDDLRNARNSVFMLTVGFKFQSR